MTAAWIAGPTSSGLSCPKLRNGSSMGHDLPQLSRDVVVAVHQHCTLNRSPDVAHAAVGRRNERDAIRRAEGRSSIAWCVVEFEDAVGQLPFHDAALVAPRLTRREGW